MPKPRSTANPHIIPMAKPLIPGYEGRGVERLRETSVIYRVDKINVPFLILHGGIDQEIPASQSLALAMRLQELKKPYELIIYGDHNHETMQNRDDRKQENSAVVQEVVSRLATSGVYGLRQQPRSRSRLAFLAKHRFMREWLRCLQGTPYGERFVLRGGLPLDGMDPGTSGHGRS
jgi:dienelactone hydrolase